MAGDNANTALPPASQDPFTAYFEKMKEAIIAGVVERLGQTSPAHPAPLDLPALGLDLFRAYSAKEVAQLLGIKWVASVYEIPDDELPRVRRIGKKVGFLGINVLCYMHALEPVDVAGALERYRERLLDERPAAVQPLHPQQPGKTRVL